MGRAQAGPRRLFANAAGVVRTDFQSRRTVRDAAGTAVDRLPETDGATRRRSRGLTHFRRGTVQQRPQDAAAMRKARLITTNAAVSRHPRLWAGAGQVRNITPGI